MSAEAELLLLKLGRYRLEYDLTYAELADQMKASDCFVPARSLHLYLTGRTTPVERTQFRIGKFVAQLTFDRPIHRKAKARRRRHAA
jgi:hypothetical protein